MRVIGFASDYLYVRELFLLDPLLQPFEHLLIDVHREDVPVGPDSVGKAHTEKAIASADVGDPRSGLRANATTISSGRCHTSREMAGV